MNEPRTTEARRYKLAVVIPCYNEAAGIGTVIRRLPRERLDRMLVDMTVVVVDNNSSDNTTEVAREAGAIVLHESKKGKGNAMRTGFANLPEGTDFVVMLDGDNTYDPGEVTRLVEPLMVNFSPVVIGSRLRGKIEGDSMPLFNLMGNKLFTTLVRMFYKVEVTDVLTGYFAWKRRVIDDLAPHLRSNGFAIEMEMITKMARLGYYINSVPISYTERAGDSNLQPVSDGWRILKMFARNLRWRPSQSAKTRSVTPMQAEGEGNGE